MRGKIKNKRNKRKMTLQEKEGKEQNIEKEKAIKQELEEKEESKTTTTTIPPTQTGKKNNKKTRKKTPFRTSNNAILTKKLTGGVHCTYILFTSKEPSLKLK